MSTAARSELTPTGSIRAGINYGNSVLAQRNERGEPQGIAADLAAALAGKLGAPIHWKTYDAAGPMADGARKNAWDVAFLAADPARAEQIIFTAPYLEIDSTYLVRADSSAHEPADLDRAGARIAVSRQSAYDLYLTRNLKRAEIVRAANPKESAGIFFSQNLDALAGIRPMLFDIAKIHPDVRVLEGRFATVQQAVGTSRGRDAAAEYLRGFVKELKQSGLLARIIERSGISGVTVIP